MNRERRPFRNVPRNPLTDTPGASTSMVIEYTDGKVHTVPVHYPKKYVDTILSSKDAIYVVRIFDGATGKSYYEKNHKKKI